MKKIYSLFIAAAAATSLPAMAQQLPNAGFEEWKTACGDTEAFGYYTGMRQRPSVEPTSWNGSSVNQKVIVEKKETLVTKVTGVNGNGVQLENKFVGVFSIGSVAPGYISFGTPWVYATSTISECDGGTYGGASFSYRPDAIRGQFKRTDTNSETSHIIFYSWTGTFKSKIGKKGSPTEVRDNVDRAIMAHENASLTPESTGTRIGYADYTFTSTSNGWQQIEVPISYDNNQVPQMYNVIISGGDYWTRDNMVEATTLIADNLELLYYSRLKSLSINGTAIDGFAPDTYEYTISGDMPEESAFTYETLGNSGSAQVAVNLDKSNNKAVFTVTNSNAGGTDVDGKTSHTYTVTFKPKVNYGGTVYIGGIQIYLMDPDHANDITNGNGKGEVHIISNGDGTCTFALPDFELDLGDGPVNLGDIVVENVKMTTEGTTTSYDGSKDGLTLTLGDAEIVANVKLTGTSDGSKAQMFITVTWLNGGEEIPIDVIFNGDLDTAGIGGIAVDNNADAPVEYFNLKGMRISSENLAPGIYIRRQGTDVKKILVK